MQVRVRLLSRNAAKAKPYTMKPKNRKFYAAMSAGALLAAAGSSVQADSTVQRTLPSQRSGASYDILFDEVTDATDLVSISAGSVYTGESGQMTISAIDVNNQVFQLFAGTFYAEWFQTNPLAYYTNNDFTQFAAPSDIIGLRIASGGYPSATLTLPAGTVLTFAVLPEPTVTFLIFSGLLLLALRRNGLIRRPVGDQ